MRFGLNYYTLALVDFMGWLLIMQLIFARGYEKKSHFVLREIIVITGYFLCVIPIMWLISVGIISPFAISMYVAVFALSCTALWFSYELTFVDTLYVASCGYAVQHIGASLGSILRYFTGMDAVSQWIRFPVENLCQLFVALICWLILTRKTPMQQEHRKKDNRVVAIAVLVLFAAIWLNIWADYENIDAGPRAAFLSGVVCKLYAIILCVLVVVIEYAITWMDQAQRERMLMEQMIHAQAEQQKMTNDSIAIINRKCHDLKHQIKYLKNVENEDQRSEYIEEIRQAVNIYDAIYHTGNDALDMVLREKTLICEEHKVQLSCMADGTCLSFMSSDDIYVLLGNAFDNAIESVLKEEDEEKRVISFQLTRRMNMVSFHLENYCKDTVTFKDDLPQTSKDDKNYHGFGVQSIKFLAEKYKGNMLMYQEDEMFYLDILFPADR